MNLDIKEIKELPDGFESLILDSKTEGFNFLERLERELRLGENTYSNPGEALYILTIEKIHVAIGGINRQSESQGRIRRFYVSSLLRKQGIGSELLKYIELRAFNKFNELVLYTDTRKAAHFYESHGYIPVSGENYSHCKRRCT